MSKGAPTPPPAPDPAQTAAATTNSNVDTAIANRTNSVGPGGSSTWSQSGTYTDPTTGQVIPQYTNTTSLNPTEQSIFSNMENTASSLSPLGGALAGQALGTTAKPLDPSGANQNIIAGGPQSLDQNATSAAFNAQKGFLDPQFAQSQKDLQDQLSRGGIPVGSDAYNNAMTNYNNTKNQAYSTAANTAVGQGQTSANNMFGLAVQGQNQQLNQQQTIQQNPLTLLSKLYGTSASTGSA